MQAIIKGDLLIPAISAASIVAKVTRDAEMVRLHEQYPQYDFAIHKGYATKRHRLLLKEHGTCPIHRRGFLALQRDLIAADALL
jgi:ribonuclease HII